MSIVASIILLLGISGWGTNGEDADFSGSRFV